MSPQPTILLSMGTRPEIIKMAPIYLELKQRGVDVQLLHTGQHSDMADMLYNMFGIVPEHHLNLHREALPSADGFKPSDLAALSSTLLLECSALLNKVNPYMVLVHGDTSSALMMAIAGYYHKCKIVHIEAGLRSNDEYHPFPEEKNRALIGHLAHMHFAPTPRAKGNLLREGIDEKNIHMVGNTIVKATLLGAELLEEQRKTAQQADTPDLISKLDAHRKGKRMLLVTSHRRENLEHGIREISTAIINMLKQYPDMLIVWPLHPNPKVISMVDQALSGLDPKLAERLYLTKPLSYPVLLWILKYSWIVLTDSGGIQEEAVSLGTPVLVLRKTTERQEIIESGAGALVGADAERILSALKALNDNPEQYAAMQNAPNPFGDGNVVHRICNILLGVNCNE